MLQRKTDAAPLFQPEGQRDTFFGPKASEPFFAPAAPPIQAKCADCEQEDKVQKKEEQEKQVQPKIQTKLKIGAPDDQYEKQADAVADQVVQRLAAPTPAAASPTTPAAADGEEKLQRKEDEVDKTEEKVQMKPIFDSASPPDENSLQRKCADCEQEDKGGIQRSSETAAPAQDSSDISSRLSASKGGGSPLPDNTRSQMEGAMGADFSGVRVHTGSEAAGMSQDIQAQAFTHGNDVYFNEGKYSPSTTDGQRLLAHELTHTVQQGAAEPSAVSRKKEVSNGLIQREVDAAPIKPRAPIDITNGFDPSPEWRAWIKAQKKNSQIPVEVKAGNNYTGTLYLSRSNQGTKGDAQDYTLTTSDGYGQKQFLEISNIPIFEEFRSKGIVPVVVIEAWKKGQPVIKGYLSVKTSKGTALAGTKGFIESFSSNIEKLGYLGIKTPKIPTVENTFEQGRLTMKTTSPMTTVVAGYLNASMSLGIINSVMTFEVNATIDIKGIASGQLDLRRDENGQFGGKVLIQAQIQNVAAELTAEYIKTAEGADVTVQGKGRINSEKFQGEVGFIVAQEAKADALMKAQLGVQSIEAESQKAKKPTKPAPNSRGNMALVGWGTVNATITSWLQGMAKVGIDSKGQVTIVGEITVPGDVKLMEERGKKITLFKVEVKGGYGIPVIGQVGLFASVELFINAGFGPLVLKNVGFTGTYSTDPTVLQNFKITGTLGINAFAVLGLAAEAGVFLTLIGHDIKAGLNVTAAAGLRAYAEATPTFEYVEQAAPTGGKVGESWLRGHFEAAAQLFLQLGGEFFVSVDSPWWSPLGDERWAYPLGQVTYPIGDSLGIGGDMAWKVGSPDVPELKLSPVEFDPDKFTADVMADPPPGKGKGGDKNEKGEWVDGEGGGDKQAVPDTKPGGPGLDGKKKKEDFTKLPDEQRFLRACDELGQMAKKSQAQPSTYKVMEAKAKQIKAKYAIEEVTLKGDKKGEKLKVSVKHKDRDNKKKEAIEVHLMTEAERLKLIEAAANDLETRIASKQDSKTHSITRADADAIAASIQKGHWVIEQVHVVDGGDSWKFELDLGDVKRINPGVGKSEQPGNSITEEPMNDGNNITIHQSFETGGENHEINNKPGTEELIMSSSNPVLLSNHPNKDVRESYSQYLQAIRSAQTPSQKKLKANETIKMIVIKIKSAGMADAPGASAPGIGTIDFHKNQQSKLRKSGIELWFMESEHLIPRAIINNTFQAFAQEGIPAGGADYQNMRTILIYKGAANLKTHGEKADIGRINELKQWLKMLMEIYFAADNFDALTAKTIQDKVFKYINDLFSAFAHEALARTFEAIEEENNKNGVSRGPEGKPEPPTPDDGRLFSAFNFQVEDINRQLGSQLEKFLKRREMDNKKVKK